MEERQGLFRQASGQQKPADGILHEVGDHAGPQALAPQRHQSEHTAVNGDDDHLVQSLIGVGGSENNALKDELHLQHDLARFGRRRRLQSMR